MWVKYGSDRARDARTTNSLPETLSEREAGKERWARFVGFGAVCNGGRMPMRVRYHGSTGNCAPEDSEGTHCRRWRKSGPARVEMQLRDAWTEGAEVRESGAVFWRSGIADSLNNKSHPRTMARASMILLLSNSHCAPYSPPPIRKPRVCCVCFVGEDPQTTYKDIIHEVSHALDDTKLEPR